MWDRICVPLCLLPNERSTNPLLGELCNLLQTGGKCLKSGFRFNSVFHHHLPKSQPLSVGIFFARNASVGAVSRLGLLSTPLQKSSFRARIPPFFSLFSAALLSIQGPKSCIGAGLRAIGLHLRLLGSVRPRQRRHKKPPCGGVTVRLGSQREPATSASRCASQDADNLPRSNWLTPTSMRPRAMPSIRSGASCASRHILLAWPRSMPSVAAISVMELNRPSSSRRCQWCASPPARIRGVSCPSLPPAARGGPRPGIPATRQPLGTSCASRAVRATMPAVSPCARSKTTGLGWLHHCEGRHPRLDLHARARTGRAQHPRQRDRAGSDRHRAADRPAPGCRSPPGLPPPPNPQHPRQRDRAGSDRHRAADRPAPGCRSRPGVPRRAMPEDPPRPGPCCATDALFLQR